MAELLKKPVAFAKDAWKGGMLSGLKSGLLQGIPAAMGFHPFFARVGGGLAAAAITKNPIDKRVILNESMKEGLYQLLAAD